MPLTVPDDAPTNFPTPGFLTMTDWTEGVITLVDKSRLPKNALSQADNLWLVEQGQPSMRPGTAWFGSPLPNSAVIDGFDYFDDAGAVHIVATGGGNVYRSTNDAVTWDLCSGATATAGNTMLMNQSSGFLYLTNGVDPIIRYDGSTTLQSYTPLSTPTAPTAVTTPSGGTGYTYYYKISAVNTVGFTEVSPSVTVTMNLDRSGWDATTNYVTLTFPAYQGTLPDGQTRYDIYISIDDLNYFYLDSTTNPNLSYKDDGSAIQIPNITQPLDNTTQGPLVEELGNVGTRMYGVRDTQNPYRIWWTGEGSYAGAFSGAYDGGYIDWQPGGKYRPIKVEDYRNGQGTPLATIWCSSADGLGSILQLSLNEETVGNLTVTVPDIFQLPGSRGTPAPGSVINVLNDYMFYNSQAFYNLGSRAQFLNLLSTDESSANIRPTVRTISVAGQAGIASVFYLDKVYFSVPYGGATSNTATIIYDTERKCWFPMAFTIGFQKFVHYTTTGNALSLLAVKAGDNQLTRIDQSIQGDYGQPFQTTLQTGLYPSLKDRFGFQWTQEGEFEFSNPQGTINVELLGIERTNGFSSQVKVQLTQTATIVGAGWNTFAWNTTPWNFVPAVPTAYSESSIKRYFVVDEELNAIQWSITTDSLNAQYILRTLQTWGTDTQAGQPEQWLLEAIGA